MDVVEFVIKELEIQKDYTDKSSYNLLRAWKYVHDLNELSLNNILILGEMVKPELNGKGFRTTPVIFKNLQRGLHHELIENSLMNLLSAQEYLTPLEFYKEFELIHPFEDGNGRIGAILYNYLSGTMNDPVIPPHIFEEIRSIK